jgi:HNH endonuclease
MASFRERVRTRDQRCVVSGVPVLQDWDFTVFHAAHIFPLAHLDLVWLPLFQFLVLCVYCF